MTIYLHLLGALSRPEEAETSDSVGWIHTLGPLDAVARFQDGRVRLNFKKKKNPQREGLDDRQWLKRVGNQYEFGGQLYATFIINHQRRYPCRLTLIGSKIITNASSSSSQASKT